MALDTLQESEIRGLDALETGQDAPGRSHAVWAWLWPKVAAVAIALAGLAGRRAVGVEAVVRAARARAGVRRARRRRSARASSGRPSPSP